MRVLHTEASGGLGGQELRILREAEGMRERGHEIVLAVKTGGGLVAAARAAGFVVYELPWTKPQALSDVWSLIRMMRRHSIDVINTHSSWDAWVGGITGRLTKRPVLRTRHLSTAIRPGWNSRVLYNYLADQVVTTCQATADTICKQADLGPDRCRSIPTGVLPLAVAQKDVDAFRERYGLTSEHIVVGTVCVLRSWKGVQDLLAAAKLLADDERLRWLIVGDGPAQEFLFKECARLGVQAQTIFSGYHKDPLPAMACMDIFALLSTAHEGVSQAALQAAYLAKPLITTSTGGLGEICLDGQTGLLCPCNDPEAIGKTVRSLASNSGERQRLGESARQLVLDKFTMERTLDDMEAVYASLKVSR